MKDALGMVIMFTVMGVGLAVLLLFCARKATAYRKWILLILAGTFGCWGLLPGISYAVDSVKLFTLSILIGMAGIFVPSPMIQLIQRKKCTAPVRAKVIDKKVSRVRYSTLWTPVFSYTFEGKNIVSDSVFSYSPKAFGKLFEMGKSYEIYINPDIPTDCADKRKFPSSLILLLAVGVLILAFAVYILCLPSGAITINSHMIA